LIWESNELLATMEGSGAYRSAEKLVEKGSLGGNEGKDWWRGIDLVEMRVIFNFAFELGVALYLNLFGHLLCWSD